MAVNTHHSAAIGLQRYQQKIVRLSARVKQLAQRVFMKHYAFRDVWYAGAVEAIRIEDEMRTELANKRRRADPRLVHHVHREIHMGRNVAEGPVA